MSGKIAYWTAIAMIVALAFILYSHYGIVSFWERSVITTYMIIYGALMALSAQLRR